MDTDDDPWLDDEQLAHWHRIVAMIELLPSALDARLRARGGLTHFEYYALHFLDEASGGALQLKTLAERTNATLARLSRVISSMSERGLVERTPHPADARATLAVITEAGRSALRAAAPDHVRHVRSLVVDRLSGTELAQLAAMSERILEALDPGERTFHRRNARRHDAPPGDPSPSTGQKP